MMFKLNAGTATLAAFTALTLGTTNALAATPPSQNARDLGSNSCKDIMLLSGQDRDVAVAFAHGYVLGKKGTTKFEIDKLTQITDKFFDYCLDHPKDNAMAVFEKMAM